MTALMACLAACKPSNTTAPNPTPDKKLAPVSSPVSAPVSVPVSQPTTTSQPTSASLPTTTSMPASTSAPTTAASLAPTSEPVLASYFLGEGGHPNPKIGDISCTSDDFKEDECETLLKTTMFLSCLCRGMRGDINSDDRGGGIYMDELAYTSVIEGDSMRELTLGEIFRPGAAMRYSEKGFTISVESGEIAITPGSSFNKPIPSDELEKLWLPNSPLVAALQATTDFPDNYDDEVASRGSLLVEALETKAAPTSMPAEGTLLRAYRWVDKNGENTALFSEQKSTSKDKLKSTTYLYVNHYRKKDEVITPVRKVVDKQEKCAKPNNLASFVEDTMRITDVDRDGVGEIGFAYQLGCVDDPGEVHPVKAFLLEGDEKYALRGDSSGEYKADKIVEEAPSIFVSYLEWLLP